MITNTLLCLFVYTYICREKSCSGSYQYECQVLIIELGSMHGSNVKGKSGIGFNSLTLIVLLAEPVLYSLYM